MIEPIKITLEYANGEQIGFLAKRVVVNCRRPVYDIKSVAGDVSASGPERFEISGEIVPQQLTARPWTP